MILIIILLLSNFDLCKMVNVVENQVELIAKKKQNNLKSKRLDKFIGGKTLDTSKLHIFFQGIFKYFPDFAF